MTSRHNVATLAEFLTPTSNKVNESIPYQQCCESKMVQHFLEEIDEITGSASRFRPDRWPIRDNCIRPTRRNPVASKAGFGLNLQGFRDTVTE
ncbi:hypothetical protein AgCh_016189 [Apium graveolens]